MVTSIRKLFFYRFSRKGILFLVLGVAGLSALVLFLPFFQSTWQWCFHRTASFEDRTVSLPRRWVSGEKGHLLSIKRTGVNLLFPYKSTVEVDPFAERWPANRLNKVSELWLHFHGYPVADRFEDSRTDKPFVFDPEMSCVSISPSSEFRYVRISCLSSDSVYSFEFFGERNAIPDFAEVTAQVLRIASKHPGRVWRK